MPLGCELTPRNHITWVFGAEFLKHTSECSIKIPFQTQQLFLFCFLQAVEQGFLI